MQDSSMVLQKAYVVTRETVLFEANVLVRNGVIVKITQRPLQAPNLARVVDCRGRFLLPGFVDMHTHGALGYDVMDCGRTGLKHYLNFHAAHGVTALLPTSTAADKETLRRFVKFIDGKWTRELKSGSRIAGVHLEGPYLDSDLCGMHPQKQCRAFHATEYRELIATGTVKRITAALERQGGATFLNDCEKKGVLVSLGHTKCSSQEVGTWGRAGLRHVTHLYNAMSRAEKQGPVRVCGCLEGALLTDGVACEIIADGHHVPRELFEIALRCKGADQITICSDSTPATGSAAEGKETAYGGITGGRMTVRNGRAVSLDGQTLVGSICPLGDMLPNVLAWSGNDWAGTAKMMSTNSCRLLGLSKQGVIAEGYYADLVLADARGGLIATWIGGVPCTPQIHNHPQV